MKRKRGIIAILLIVAILILGIGYALATNTLTINGSLSATTDDTNFLVEFDNSDNPTATVSANGTATATYTDKTTATFSVEDFTSINDTATFTYEIVNNSTSEDLVANLEANVTGFNADYYTVDTSFDTTEITIDDTATLTVVVTMIKTPLNETDAAAATTTGTVTITATATTKEIPSN